MSEVVDRLWEQIEPVAYITREQFARDLEEWTIEPVRIDGRLAFAALTRGPEFHFASFLPGHSITRAMIRARLDPIVARHGFVTTRTPRDGADRQHRFNLAFGFKVAGEDEHFVHYRLDKTCR